MTAYKNFTQAMTSRGIDLNVHEQRHGYSRNEDGTLRAVSVKKIETDTVANQHLSDNYGTYVFEIADKAKNTDPVNIAIAKKSPFTVFVGGDFKSTEVVMKRSKNPNGPGYFRVPTEVTKVSPGVVELGDYVFVAIEPSKTNPGFVKIVSKKI